jgi:hypothetical protein
VRFEGTHCGDPGTVQSDRSLLTFRRNVAHPSSGHNIEVADFSESQITRTIWRLIPEGINLLTEVCLRMNVLIMYGTRLYDGRSNSAYSAAAYWTRRVEKEMKDEVLNIFAVL